MLKQVTANVYQLGGIGDGFLGANMFLLRDARMTVVDTGFGSRATRIVKAANRLGYAPTDIARIIITHHHPDHTGGLADLKRATGAEVVAHRADAPHIDGRSSQLGASRPRWLAEVLAPLYRPFAGDPVAVDTPVEDGQELPVLGGARVVHTPGHTPGSICLMLEQERLVIVGDLLVHRFGLRLPSKPFTGDILEEVRSIRKLASLDFDVACFGHGSPLSREPRTAVARFADRLERKYRLADRD